MHGKQSLQRVQQIRRNGLVNAARLRSLHPIASAQVPLVRDRKAPRGRVVQATVWEWHGAAEDQGDEAASWLTAYLGRPARLLRYIGEGD